MSFKLSILTPSYNSVKFLDRAIQSVLDQDYTNWEHIVIDADSKDGTKQILFKHSHLIWASEPDKGQSDAMNKAFKKSSGDIIVYLNADDYFAPGAFSRIVSVFNSLSDIDIVVGNLEISNEMNGSKQVIVPTINLSDMLKIYQGFIFPANPVSYFYRKKVQSEIGEFPINNHYTMDYWFLLRVLSKYKVHKLDYILGTFTMYGTNKTSDIVLSNTHQFVTALEFLQSDPVLNSLKWSEVIVKQLHTDLSALKTQNKGLLQEIDAIRNTFIWRFRTFLRNLLK
jgi:glycosyltransferase involved in cell wall biosynthesis